MTKVKKSIASLLALIIVLAMLPISGMEVFAETTSDGFEYSISDGEATITGYSGTATDLEIPSEIDGYPVTSIQYYAFYGDTLLESVTIPDSVTEIGEGAFAGCSSLISINVSSTDFYYCSVDGVVFNKDMTTLCIYPAGKGGTYSIPDSVTEIGDSAFESCESLTGITIPDSVIEIGEGAFYECTSLTDVIIGNSVEIIWYNAFSDCTSLESITLPNSLTTLENWAFFGCISLKSIVIPDSVTVINDGAFSYCSALKSVTIGNGLETINNSDFWCCTSLTEVNVSSGNANYCSADGVLFNKDMTTIVWYPEAKTATTYAIPSSVNSIGFYAFRDCTSLKTITIPDSVVSISQVAFSGCTSLTSIAIPDSVTSIGEYAFDGCTSLTTIIIPESVTSIRYGMFRNCTSLTSITIPDSVTSIGFSVFQNCTSLMSVYIPDSVTDIGYHAFGYTYNTDDIPIDSFTIYGYTGSVAETYASDNGFTFVDLNGATSGIVLNNIANSVTAYADEGTVAEDAELQVINTDTTETAVTYDITLVQNGEEIQPDGSVTVKIPVPDTMDGTIAKVFRAEEDETYINMNAVYADGYMIFTTDHFSKYVLTTEDLDADLLLGDANGDGNITAADALQVLRYAVGNPSPSTLTSDEFKVADYNEDGSITAADALAILRVAVGLV